MTSWFDRELQAINPLYFSAYNPKTKKWTIRKWLSAFKLHRIDPWGGRSVVVMAVKYPALDNRTLADLRRGLWQARRIKMMLAEIDEANRLNEKKIDAEQTAMHREGAKDIYHHYQEPTVCLSGKEFKSVDK